jgi:amino acid adenylation domain-containing protein
VKINETLHKIQTNELITNASKKNSVIDLFIAQVEKTPNHIAINAAGKTYSYATLDTLSNKLAQCLREKYAVNANDIVAVKLDRDEWLLITILALLKIGASYLPIDIQAPKAREAYILKDANVTLIVTTSNIKSETTFNGKLFTVDLEFDATAYDAIESNAILSDDQTAYIMYTSGSTGKPKGTIISHASLQNYLEWGKSYYLNNLETVSFGLFTSIAFDLTVTSMFLPLISGGTLTTYNTSKQITEVLESYLKNQHSCIKLTPAHIMVLDTLQLQSSNLKVAIVGGDVLHQSHVDSLLKINPKMRIFNEYGPTEATVGCVVHEVVANQDIVIGKPIQNTEVYVLDEDNQLVAQGETGELHIAGAGLAKGYLNNTALTNQKFIQNPFEEDKKLYKTGDLVKWVDTENLKFIGRIDNQIKLRGYRIELGEIEKQLLQKEQIKEAVVTLIHTENDEKQLVAYITATSVENITEIRNFLQEKIPEYMIPSVFVQLEEFPLTINGKIATKTLTPQMGTILKSGTSYVAPKSDTEKKLVAIWEEILQVEKVGVQDNFFELGGNSIYAIKLIAKIYKELEILLEATNILEGKTIETISEYIDTIQIFEKQENTIDNSDLNEKLIF